MRNLEAIELPNGKFGIQAVGEPTLFEDAGEFDSRDEAEDWIFNRVEQLSLHDDPHTLTPGSGQGPR
jgi:hypothetical protein